MQRSTCSIIDDDSSELSNYSRLLELLWIGYIPTWVTKNTQEREAFQHCVVDYRHATGMSVEAVVVLYFHHTDREIN